MALCFKFQIAGYHMKELLISYKIWRWSYCSQF